MEDLNRKWTDLNYLRSAKDENGDRRYSERTWEQNVQSGASKVGTPRHANLGEKRSRLPIDRKRLTDIELVCCRVHQQHALLLDDIHR